MVVLMPEGLENFGEIDRQRVGWLLFGPRLI